MNFFSKLFGTKKQDAEKQELLSVENIVADDNIDEVENNDMLTEQFNGDDSNKVEAKENNLQAEVVNIEPFANIELQEEQSDLESLQNATATNEKENKLSDISKKLLVYNKTKTIAEELSLLSFDRNAEKKDYDRLLSLLKSIANEEHKRTVAHKDLLSALNDINSILMTPFNEKFNGFANFFEHFPNLTTEYSILEKLSTHLPYIYQDKELNGLYENYKSVSSAFNAATTESISLKQEQDLLSNEIIKYTNTVNEAKQKYRLSIDWEGKKPILISFGKKLGEKRAKLEEKEETLNKELLLLYENYPSLQKLLFQNSEQIITTLKDKIADFNNMENIEKVIGEVIFDFEEIIQIYM